MNNKIKKIRIRGGSDWKNFCQRLCLAVSITSPRCTGDDFLAALNFVKNYGKDFFIDLSDTLHTPNLIASGLPAEEARNLAHIFGNDWIHSLDEHLEGISIIRWAHWHTHADYCDVYEKFQWLYLNNATFQAIINDDIKNFSLRHPERNTPEYFIASKDYILDECTGKTLQGRDFPGLAILYPGLELRSLSSVREGLIKGVPSGLENTRHVRYSIESRTIEHEELQERVA